MSSTRDLHPTTRFSDRTDDYVKFRPSYPAEAIDAVTAGFVGSPARKAADVGAGTGISARLIADRGIDVVAIEPNQSMREAAAAHPRVVFRDGTAEHTGLAHGALDLVVAAQAFHWFRRDEALREFARILRPGGRLSLLWNRRSQDDPFTAGYRAAILAVGADSSVERMDFDAASLTASGLFTNVRRLVLPFRQVLDRDGLVGRAMSASYVPKVGKAAENVTALLSALHAQYADRDGNVELVYVTEVYLAETKGVTAP